MTIPWKNNKSVSQHTDIVVDCSVEDISSSNEYNPEFLNLHSHTICEISSFFCHIVHEVLHLHRKLTSFISDQKSKKLPKNVLPSAYFCVVTVTCDTPADSKKNVVVTAFFIKNKEDNEFTKLKHRICLIKTNGKHRKLLLHGSYFGYEYFEFAGRTAYDCGLC